MQTIACPSCSASVSYQQSSAPQAVSCPKCKGQVRVPPTATIVTAPVIRTRCPHCGKGMAARPEHAGKMARCPGCQKVFPIQDVSPPPAAIPVPPPVVAPPPAPPPSTVPPAWPRWAFVGAGLAVLLGAGLLLGAWFRSGSQGGEENTGGGEEEPSEKHLPPADLERTLLRGARRAFLSVRPADLWRSPPLRELWSRVPPAERAAHEQINKEFGFAATDDVERVSVVLREPDDGLALFRLSRPWGKERREKLLHRQGNVQWERKSKAGLEYWEASAGVNLGTGAAKTLAVYIHSDDLFIAGPSVSIERLLGQIASNDLPPPGQLASLADQALERKPHIMMAGTMSKDDVKSLPKMAGMFAHQQKIRHSALAAWFDEGRLRLEGAMEFEDGKAAEESRSTLARFKTAGEWLVKVAPPGLGQREQLMVEVMKLAAGMEVKRDGNGVVIRAGLDMKKALAMLPKELPPQVTEGQERFSGAKNLREVAEMLNRYHQAHGHYPPLVQFSKEGKALYSWRVCLIPYLPEAERKRYQGFDPGLAWNEGKNKALLERVPAVYTHPMVPQAGKTRGTTPYLVLTGPGGNFAPGKVIARGSIKDGPARTVMLVVSRKVSPWAGPVLDVEVPVEPAKVEDDVIPYLGLHPGLPFEVALFDGTVRSLPRTISGEMFLEASRPDDGKGLAPE